MIVYGNNAINAYSVMRDNDVLDTWFSSALWPFGTLGWPEAKQTLSPSGESGSEERA